MNIPLLTTSPPRGGTTLNLFRLRTRAPIKLNGDARYIRRDAKGRIRKSGEGGRSLKQDRAC